jgi:hypothetical protein
LNSRALKNRRSPAIMQRELLQSRPLLLLLQLAMSTKVL